VRIAAISDLHIGTRDRTCGFRHDPVAFGALLDRLEADHDEIVLLGDIWQLDHEALPGRTAALRALRRARARAGWLDGRIAGGGYTVVHGNHDAWIAAALDAPTRVLRSHGGRTVLLEHGDAHDPVLGQAPRVSHTATWFTGRLRWAGLRWPAEQLEEQDVQIKARRFQGEAGPYAAGARSLAEEHRADLVVMGHTHVPTLLDLGGTTLANTGTCSRRRFMGVSVDLARGEVALLGPGARVTRSAAFG
jgi:predicted phosphodiesterase